MPFTLEQLDFLSLHVGVAIPPEFIENKRRAAEFKTRSGELTARSEEMKQRRDGAALEEMFKQAAAAAEGRDFAAALELLDQLESGLAAPEPPDDGEFLEKWKVAKEAWLRCLEVVDRQIDLARSAMLASDDPDFKIIADRGLPALTNNHKTPVMTGLFELESTRGREQKDAAVKAGAAIAAFRKHLDSYHLIQALDQHSKTAFGVSLTIRSEIGKGLGALEDAIQPILAG